MRAFLAETRKKVPLAVVGGSDLAKIQEQLADCDQQKCRSSFLIVLLMLIPVISQFDYVFAENGLIGYKGELQYPTIAIQDHLGEEKLQELINFVLKYFSEVTLPVKRGNFVEFRKVVYFLVYWYLFTSREC